MMVSLGKDMGVRAYLYDAGGHDREIGLEDIDIHAVSNDALLWIDLEGDEAGAKARVAGALSLQSPVAVWDGDRERTPVANHGDFLCFRIVLPAYNEPGAASVAGGLASADILFAIGKNWVLTSHSGPATLLKEFQENDDAETLIGALSTASFVAALVDRHLGLYFEAASRISEEVEALDERVLRDKANKTLLGRIVMLRRKCARLRALLVANRSALYALARPDCMLIIDSGAGEQYFSLTTRFERALDEIERARDLVNGSFDLFASRSGLQTNNLVKALTIVTAVFGYFGAVAGLLGMNLRSTIFNGGDGTFALVVGTLTITSAIAIFVARVRKWI
ncbi:CorA family divalent cation transporter [Sphingomonas sp. RT2P30]|uniref:magnesium transporter CorA family protein n=1 Tax=Parasphingomonas halimpatiens TaxID=3096162 RepID=UPI002FC5D70A